MNNNQEQNMNTQDRLIRVILSEILLLGAFFWFGGLVQTILYVVGVVILLTALTGFCGLYKICKIEPVQKPLSRYVIALYIILFLLIGTVGGYYSVFFTKKIFLDDYNHMNNSYKQTLFYTGQNMRKEAILNYDLLAQSYPVFALKYSDYHPYSIKSDYNFNSDIQRISDNIISLKDLVYTGDLKNAHLEFESIRPIFQDILKRNNFSLLAVSLVDFHDAMEKIIAAADEKNSAEIIDVYSEVEMKLKVVEESANDSEIQTIRLKLEEVYGLAKKDQKDLLAAKAAELKSAFVKVYLKRG